MWIVLILLIIIWTSKRNTAPDAVSSAGGRWGGWHSPNQTLALGGQNIIGNQWDNGTASGQINSQWSGYDDAGDGMVYAIQGGEDGQNPSLAALPFSSTQVTTFARFRMLGGGDPRRPPLVPNNVSSLNDVVRR